jgi:hypothetical protein
LSQVALKHGLDVTGRKGFLTSTHQPVVGVLVSM